MSLRDHLQEIHDQHGQLTPELVVEVARPKSHPLHHRVFDRPPKEAAQAWYLHRAHVLIQKAKVTYLETEEGAKEVRAFHAVPSEGVQSFVYEPAEKVAADPFTRRLVLSQMERQWKDLFARYEQFEEFISMVSSDVKRRRRKAA